MITDELLDRLAAAEARHERLEALAVELAQRVGLPYPVRLALRLDDEGMATDDG
jgi:hypothetical protein